MLNAADVTKLRRGCQAAARCNGVWEKHLENRRVNMQSVFVLAVTPPRLLHRFRWIKCSSWEQLQRLSGIIKITSEHDLLVKSPRSFLLCEKLLETRFRMKTAAQFDGKMIL